MSADFGSQKSVCQRSTFCIGSKEGTPASRTGWQGQHPLWLGSPGANDLARRRAGTQVFPAALWLLPVCDIVFKQATVTPTCTCPGQDEAGLQTIETHYRTTQHACLQRNNTRALRFSTMETSHQRCRVAGTTIAARHIFLFRSASSGCSQISERLRARSCTACAPARAHAGTSTWPEDLKGFAEKYLAELMQS